MSNEARIFKDKLRFGVCEKCDGVGADLHVCPYAEDVLGISDDFCNCCSNCTNECADDI